MLNPTVLIDNSYFIFDCVNTINSQTKSIDFTYKVEEGKTTAEIIKKYFELLKKINNYPNFKKMMLNNKNKHCHRVQTAKQLDLIEKIYLSTKHSKTWISQNILNNIWQIKLDESKEDYCSRLFFIRVDFVGDNLTIIKPLFIDINHLVYPDKKLSKEYGECLVCHQQNCVL